VLSKDTSAGDIQRKNGSEDKAAPCPYKTRFLNISPYKSGFRALWAANWRHCSRMGGQQLREAQPFGDFRAAGSTRRAAIVARKRHERGLLLPLRRFALLPLYSP
jgi:hypothetical protein